DPERPGWRETRSNVIDYKGDQVPYTISDTEALWKEVPAADLEELRKAEPDRKLDKRLRMALTPRRDKKAQPDHAEMSVYVLPGAADATQEARRFVEEVETLRIKEANPELSVTFQELTDPAQGDPSPEGPNNSTPVVRLLSNVKDSKSSNRLFVI